MKKNKILNLSLNVLFNKSVSIYNKIKFRHNATDQELDFKWHEKKHNRISLVNYLISKAQGINSRYLEIGCDTNSLFNSVACLNKIGVDPVKGGTHRMTSDLFFKKNLEKFDVIFIDGLHEYKQVRKDCINALKFLKINGWVAFHDFLPQNWMQEHVPRISNSWTGDCWKVAIELNKSTGIKFKIAKIDRGICLLKKISDNPNIADLSADLHNLRFKDYLKKINDLPICEFEDIIKFIDK